MATPNPDSGLVATPVAAGRPFILLPLYIYPTPTAWEPLYSAAASHPDLDFFVVVNPGNGPGPGVLPDANYVDVLARLTALGNVKVLGYVHCTYGQRVLDDIVAEVSAYRGWTEAAAQLPDGRPIVVDGIFIDEVPSSTEFVEYLTTLSHAAKTLLDRTAAVDVAGKETTDGVTSEGAHVSVSAPASTTTTTAAAGAPVAQPQEPGTLTPSNSTAIVIYNPGVVIDPIFYQAADYVVAFEEASLRWTEPEVLERFVSLPEPLRQRSIAVAHSTAGGAAEVSQLGRKCFEMGCSGLFITTQPGYTDWCPFWADFVSDVARRTTI